MKRICVWSGPRNVSTALMYSFAQRADTAVVDEPLYAAYLARCERREEHPLWREVMASQPTELDQAVGEGMLAPRPEPVLFIKNMAQHWRGLDPALLSQFSNVLLFRHPALVARSFEKIIGAPTAEDLGYPMQLEIRDVLQRAGLPVVGLDSSSVRNSPEASLRGLCERLGVEFDPAMLCWPAGARVEDGVWAPEWYGNVHRSTGFLADQSAPPELSELPEHLRGVVAECIPMWEALRAV